MLTIIDAHVILKFLQRAPANGVQEAADLLRAVAALEESIREETPKPEPKKK